MGQEKRRAQRNLNRRTIYGLQGTECLTQPARQAQTSVGGNNITINTGPVTSHMVLLNLFPASTSAKKPAQIHQEKQMRGQLQQLKRVYGNTLTTSSKTPSSQELKVIFSTNTSTSNDKKNRILKFRSKAPAEEKKMLELSLVSLPLAKHRLEASQSLKPSAHTETRVSQESEGFNTLKHASQRLDSKASTKSDRQSHNLKALTLVSDGQNGEWASLPESFRFDSTHNCTSTVNEMNRFLQLNPMLRFSERSGNEETESSLCGAKFSQDIHNSTIRNTLQTSTSVDTRAKPLFPELPKGDSAQTADQRARQQGERPNEPAVPMQRMALAQEDNLEWLRQQVLESQDQLLRTMQKSQRNFQPQIISRSPDPTKASSPGPANKQGAQIFRGRVQHVSQTPRQSESGILIKGNSLVVQVAMQRMLQAQQTYIAALEKNQHQLMQVINGSPLIRLNKAPQSFNHKFEATADRLQQTLSQILNLNQSSQERLAEINSDAPDNGTSFADPFDKNECHNDAVGLRLSEDSELSLEEVI